MSDKAAKMIMCGLISIAVSLVFCVILSVAFRRPLREQSTPYQIRFGVAKAFPRIFDPKTGTVYYWSLGEGMWKSRTSLSDHLAEKKRNKTDAK